MSDLESLARRVRVSVPYLKAILAGRRRCPFVLACRLSAALGVPLDAFLNSRKKGDPKH